MQRDCILNLKVAYFREKTEDTVIQYKQQRIQPEAGLEPDEFAENMIKCMSNV